VRDGQVEWTPRQARKFRPDDLRRGLDLLAQADADVRNGTLPNRLLIELVITRLASVGSGV
jgi:hypothetical protein